MRRRSYLAGTLLFASCAGTNAQPAPSSALAQQSAPVVVAAPALPAPTPPAVATDVAELERHWRHQIATAADPVPAACELAALLADLERHEEAVAMIDAMLARGVAPELGVVRAGLLRDLGQRHLAVAQLRAVVAGQDTATVHPGLLFELAELEWLEGDGKAAAATLQTLAGEPANAAWCQEHAASLRAVTDEVARARAPSTVRVRDLLGNLRGAPLATVRLATLDRLVAGVGVAGPDGQRLRELAIAIAAGDESAAVRARAVSLAAPEPDAAPEFLAVALADDSQLVRRAAVDRSLTLLGERARELLLRRLEVEEDDGVFAALDRALASLVPEPITPGAGDALTPAARAQAVARWRARWPAMP